MEQLFVIGRGQDPPLSRAMVKLGAQLVVSLTRPGLFARLDQLALRPVLHLPGMLEDMPGDAAGGVVRGPAVEHRR